MKSVGPYTGKLSWPMYETLCVKLGEFTPERDGIERDFGPARCSSFCPAARREGRTCCTGGLHYDQGDARENIRQGENQLVSFVKSADDV